MSHGQRVNDASRGRGCRFRVRALRAAMGLLLALTAGAQAAPPSVKVTISRSDAGRPVPPGTGGAATARPELEAEQVLPVPGLDGSIRADQEQILVDLIANTPDTEAEEKADYYFRLGELHAKLHRHWRQKSGELTARAAQAKDAKTKAEATAAAEQTKQFLQKAVRTLKGLTENEAFRNFPRRDVALFYLGYTLRSGGLALEARQAFDKLLKNHPSSKHAPEAHLLIGEHAFQAGQLTDAENQYKIVLVFPRSAAYWYAMYKLGWVHLGSQRFANALEAFYQVAQATKNDPKLESLHHAALRDFVRAYAEVGKPDKATPAFQRVDSQNALEMLQLLADLYLEQGKSDQAIYVYQELLKTAPADQNACSWQYNSALAATYNTGKGREVQLCTADVARFQEWARASGVRAACPSCAQAPKLP